MFYKIYFKIDRAYNKFRRKKRGGFIFSIAAAIAATVFSATAGVIGAGAAAWLAVGVGVVALYGQVGLLVYGGIALSKTAGAAGKNMSTGIAMSPSYSSPTLQTQTNNDLPIAMPYGEVKLAGNRIWQNESGESTIKRLVAFGYGEIEDFTDIRLNDILYTEISGCTVEKFYGTPTQQISTLVPGATNAARAEVVGSLKHIAYLAISCPKTDKINENYNLTAVIKGRKVRNYSNTSTYTTVYSNNPAWGLLDAMLSYNGAGMALLNTGLIDDTTLAKHLDIQSFIDAAAYCDGTIAYYELTTALTGNNNDLIWKARAANDSTVSITYTNAGASKPLTVTVTGKDIDIQLATNGSSVITSTANDIISLINNDENANALVKVCNADSNDGSGLVTVLSKTFLTAGTGQKRFQFNMIFDSDFAVRDAIEEFKKNCRGALVTKGEKLQFKIDSPGDVVQVLDEEDIIIGSEVYTPIPMEEHYDILKIKYISPDYEWAKVQAQAELFEYKNEPAICHSVDIYSITNHQQASLLGWYYLNRKILCPFSFKFSTDYRISEREIGDIITVPSLLMGQTYTGKIVKLFDDNSGVFDVSIISYDTDLYNDEMASATPTVIVSNINDPYAIPADITNFNVVQNLKLLQFTWQEISGTNITYEIREGESWINSTLVASKINGNSYTLNLNKKGTLKYWIKAWTGMQYSENAIFDVIQVNLIPDLNIVVEENILENASGDFTNTYIYRNRLKLNPTALWQDLTPEKWADSGDRYYADLNNFWNSTVETSGVYESQVYDIGANLNSIVSSNYNVYKADASSSAVIEWRYSEDNITWSDYALINTGSYQFRYYQTRITINSPSGKPVMVSNFVMNVDVPDREENYTNREITNATNGITITFASDLESKIAETFIISEPQILATSKSNSAYAVVTAVSATSCTIKLYNNSGTLTTGFVNIRARGY